MPFAGFGEPLWHAFERCFQVELVGLADGSHPHLIAKFVTIDGDVETGQAFKGILDAMDIDWEEQLSKFTGDVIAHQLANGVRRAGTVLRHGRHTLEQDVGEYLQEELRVLLSRIETENFSHDVTRLNMDADRLAARVKRLLDNRSTASDS